MIVFFYLQFFTETNNDGLSFYLSDYDNYENNDLDNEDIVETEIDELLIAIYRINKAISKIQIKIEQIKDICNEYELNFEDFIHLVYDFDK